MSTGQNDNSNSDREIIAWLESAAWKQDGSPRDKNAEYWLKIEQRFRAVRQLLAEEFSKLDQSVVRITLKASPVPLPVKVPIRVQTPSRRASRAGRKSL